jgi:hypothetical protein
MIKAFPDLYQAEAIFAISNTPLFLMRKLRYDPAVLKIAREHSGVEILQSLHELSGRTPENEHDWVLPYVLLVALSLKDDLSPLREAEKITIDYTDWYKYIARFLIESIIPTDRPIIRFKQALTSPNTSTIPSSATQKVVLK